MSILPSVLLLSLAARTAFAEVAIRVLGSEGLPVEGALVTLDDGTQRVSDAEGLVRFQDHHGQLLLQARHAWFQPLMRSCVDGDTLRLLARDPALEEVLVTAERDQYARPHPLSAATWQTHPREESLPARQVMDLLATAPGVAESGQGGLLQAWSVRGSGGQRVLGQLEGVPIVTERRAGTSLSFIDPLLLSSVTVVRGPASTYHGSGALGGVIDARLHMPEGAEVRTGWQSQGQQWWIQAGTGNERWSVALAHRRADGSETSVGERLPDQFEQWSAVLGHRRTTAAGLRLGLWLAPSLGQDIGKPNTRYPERETVYPLERHLLSRATLERPQHWSLALSAHPSLLRTDVRSSSGVSRVENRSTDLGLALSRQWKLPREWQGRLGVDWAGRRGVRAEESQFDAESGSHEQARTLDGQQDELAGWGTLRHTRLSGRLAGSSLIVGARANWIRQANRSASTASDNSRTAFVGASLPMGEHLELLANLGSGHRFPGLSERFYSGTTGRGSVLANAGLAPERSLSAETGLRIRTSRAGLTLTVFRAALRDWIERITLEDGSRSYRNLTEGTQRGMELEGHWDANSALRLEAGASVVRGRASDGTPLADSPTDRLQLGLHLNQRSWQGALRWQHRWALTRPGPGDVAIGPAEILDASLSRQLGSTLWLTASARNLLNRLWLPSADEQAVPAPGRSVGLELHWQP